MWQKTSFVLIDGLLVLVVFLNVFCKKYYEALKYEEKKLKAIYMKEMEKKKKNPKGNERKGKNDINPKKKKRFQVIFSNKYTCNQFKSYVNIIFAVQ